MRYYFMDTAQQLYNQLVDIIKENYNINEDEFLKIEKAYNIARSTSKSTKKIWRTLYYSSNSSFYNTCKS